MMDKLFWVEANEVNFKVVEKEEVGWVELEIVVKNVVDVELVVLLDVDVVVVAVVVVVVVVIVVVGLTLAFMKN